MNNTRDSHPPDTDAPYSHAADTSIPDGEIPDSSASSIKAVLLFWLLLLIVSAVIGFGVQIAASSHDQSHDGSEHQPKRIQIKARAQPGGKVALEPDCVVAGFVAAF